MAEATSHPVVDRSEFKYRFIKELRKWQSGKKREKKEEDEKDRVVTKSTPPEHEIYGFENEIKSLENFLLDKKVYKDFRSLVIVGEYGVGKTALCQTIFNTDGVKSVYAPRIWVSMHGKETGTGEDKKISVLKKTGKDDKKAGKEAKISVLKKMLKDLGVKDKVFESIQVEAREEAETKKEDGTNDGETKEDKEISGLLYALHLNLRWKKYLIVFDDVREEDFWNEKLDEKLKEDEKWGKHLSDGFPKGSGGRVIYTTREETLAEKLVPEKHQIHRLWPLSDHLSVWKIYEAVVIQNGKEPPRNDKKCIDELMNKSRGLPLAARLIAELDPVFLDGETVAQDGSANGKTDAANNQPTNQTTP